VRLARARGATPGVLAALAPPAIVMSWIGLTALRPQLITLVFLCGWLQMIERDRRGERSWIPLALIAHVVWLNLHAGFVVGMAFLLLHGLEQAVRRRPFVHVLAVVVVMLALVALNPYGLAYYRYLAEALTMSRPNIGEWQPIWRAHPFGKLVYVLSLAMALAALRANGLARSTGWPILAAAAYLAASHERHVSIYALVWLAYVPALVSSTSLGDALERVQQRWGVFLWSFLLVVGLAYGARTRPWDTPVMGRTTSRQWYAYPVGPVDYLQRQGFAGNVLLPFETGAYVSWKTDGRVKVSIDSRFEAAFRSALLAEHLDFFYAGNGWRSMLDRYPHDLILVERDMPVAPLMRALPGWSLIYEDDAFLLFARSGLALPYVDRRGQDIVGVFP